VQMDRYTMRSITRESRQSSEALVKPLQASESTVNIREENFHEFRFMNFQPVHQRRQYPCLRSLPVMITTQALCGGNARVIK